MKFTQNYLSKSCSQTDGQTNKPRQIHNLLAGGNNDMSKIHM